MKILLILEGANESDFFESLLDRFGLQAEMCVVGTNLYSLYDRCKAYKFECDIRDVLREIVPDEKICETLHQENFTYTYLVFDADLHHKISEYRKTDISIKKLLEENFPKLIEMAKYFTDETDPSVGRLYINYPMLESFRYCDYFDEDGYPADSISIHDMHKFKQLASQKKLAGRPVTKYTKDNFSGLIHMNLRRLKSVSGDCFEDFPDYLLYRDISRTQRIASNQFEKIKSSEELYILNTSIFMLLDYYGNRDSFYDHIIT